MHMCYFLIINHKYYTNIFLFFFPSFSTEVIVLPANPLAWNLQFNY